MRLKSLFVQRFRVQRRDGLGLVVVMSGVLAACGGAPSTPSAPPTAPASGASVGGSHATSTYKQTAVGNALLSGFFCISPQYPAGTTLTNTATVSQNVAFNQTYNGHSGLTAVTSTIALDGCSNGPESDIEIDYYAASDVVGHSVAALDEAQLLEYTSNFSPATPVTVTYAVPGGVARALAFGAPGADSTENLTVNGDGSYTNASVTLNGVWPYDAQTFVQNGDGSGTDTTVAGANPSAAPYVVSYSAPVSGYVHVSTAGTQPVDPVLPTPIPCATACASPSPTPSTLPAWYPFTPSSSQPLETIATVDKGQMPLPPRCSVSPPIPSSADELETTDRALDIWRGIAVMVTDSYMDPTRGLLCAVINVKRTYYTLGTMTPTGSDTLAVTESLESQSGTAVPFLSVAPARIILLWR